MTKQQLSNYVSNRTGLTPQQSILAIEAMMKGIKSTLINNEPVYLRGFGTFKPHVRKQKTGRIITRNQPIIIPAHLIAKFIPCKDFSNKMKRLEVKG